MAVISQEMKKILNSIRKAFLQVLRFDFVFFDIWLMFSI